MVTPLRYVKLLPVVLKLLPLQGARFATHKKPRALPWAKSFCPFRARCLYWLLASSERAAYMSFLALQGVLLIWAFGLLGVLLI